MIYSVTILNKKDLDKQFKLNGAIVTASSENEAMGEAIGENLREFSSKDGWNIAQVLVLEVPIEEEALK